jgi:nicotinamide-nucleotide amidase
MMFGEERERRAAALLEAYADREWMIVTAESCTGGLVSALLTEIAGSSRVVERGFVTYSNEAKAEELGVDPHLLTHFGAVSSQVARAMAEGAIERSRADVEVAITGVAGPGGGTEEKPVGLVHLAFATSEGAVRHIERRYGDIGRSEIRLAALDDALTLLEEALQAAP